MYDLDAETTGGSQMRADRFGGIVTRLLSCLTISTIVLLCTSWATAQSDTSSRESLKRKRMEKDSVAPSQKPPQPKPRPVKPVVRPSDVVNPLASAVKPSEIDTLLETELTKAGRELSPITRDEDFLRRVTIDLTGSPPTPDKLDEFIADKRPDKRSRVIDELLSTEGYARNWARYWRDVIRFHAIDPRSQITAPKFEEWLTEQLSKNVHWDKIATELITAKGKTEEDGRTYLIFSQFDMENTAVNVAAEATRVFLGIQISCAQCHDHPYDQWKREQFHEMAAFFARTLVFREPGNPRTFEVRSKDDMVRGRPGFAKAAVAKKKGGVLSLEHGMPDKSDPEKTHTMHPAFLLGQKPGEGLSDVERRELFASYVTDANDPWFARAYVNRIWGELMGEGFYEPVDDLGPGREARFPLIINRLASAWRASGYDVKWLFRLIMNTQAYQREIRPRDPSAESTPFAAVCPTRLSADQIFDSLVNALGVEDSGPTGRMNYAAAKRGIGGGARFQISREFGVDPSAPNDDVQGTVPQALFFMNSPLVAQRINANGDTMLSRWLSVYTQDEEVIRLIYKRVLARSPSANELETCQEYLRQVGDRKEAFEDLLWSLVNSTEFITKR
jgi:Protein of unknown function (DUF1549)/Protein of unknown function (DUF1553)